MKRIVTGILAHVDAGKTTCIESMMYNAGKIKKMGQIDHQDTFLDYDAQERQRGITIFNKQVHFEWNNYTFHLLDTPGHIDFSSEMERTLQVLDLAVILINGCDGVQSHTKTIWKCLEHYKVPTLIFVNKMDISHRSKEALCTDIQTHCSNNCIDATDVEKLALVNEDILETYLETEQIDPSLFQQALYTRQVFPIYFGSALKNEGIQDLMNAIASYTLTKEYGQAFGAKIYQITMDENNNPLAHIKVTSGCIHPKDKIDEFQKVDQIRYYNGNSYQMIQEASAGMICTLKGLQDIKPGQGLGIEKSQETSLLNAYMNYQLLLPEKVDVLEMIKYCKILAQEDPQLQMRYDSKNQTIYFRIMGEIQKEILQKRLEEKSHVHVDFGPGQVLFKETIAESVIGVGHYEPLRHYAEVHLCLEPLPRNSGLQFECKLPTDQLDLHWQRLILSHLQEKEHIGVLTGSAITDMKISLVAAKAHQKHTEAGDFREATYRAIRHGLMKTNSILLEPYYQFTITINHQYVSKCLFDLEQRHCQTEVSDLNDQICIQGQGPIRYLLDYAQTLLAMTKGQGHFSCQPCGYQPSPDATALIQEIQYDPLRDTENPCGSIFCHRGGGFFVNYDEVENYMHIPFSKSSSSNYQRNPSTIKEEEVKRVFSMLGGQNKNEKKKSKPPVKKVHFDTTSSVVNNHLPECLLIDGYNMLYSWDSLKEVMKQDIHAARETLISDIVNYQAFRGCKVILVFDGYRMKNNPGSSQIKENTQIIYTKSGVTADRYIEKQVHDLKNSYKLLVATSDGLIQNSILANGATRMSARELEKRVRSTNKKALEYLK